MSTSNFPPPNILLFEIGWPGNGFALHIIGPHVAALKLYTPLSITLVKKESTKPGSHGIVELEYLARDGLAPCKLVAYAGESHFAKSCDFLAGNYASTRFTNGETL